MALESDKTLDKDDIMREINTVLGGVISTPSAANRKDRLTMPSITAPSFYVYILCRPDKKLPQGRAFYVGKGKDDRVYGHEREARRGCTCHKCSVIRKVWREGGQIRRYIIFTTDNESEALAYEVETIALYGRKNLTNLTDGGEGVTGVIVSAETRAKHSAHVTARYANPDERKKQGARMKAVMTDPAIRAKDAAASRKRWAQPHARPDMQKRMAVRYADPAERQRQSERSKEIASREGETERRRDLGVATWKDPETRAKRTAGVQRSNADPAVRAKISASLKARLSDKEELSRIRQANKAARATPESRAKSSAASKAIWARRKAEQQAGKDES